MFNIGSDFIVQSGLLLLKAYILLISKLMHVEEFSERNRLDWM